jgi:hypothetical protein
MRCNQYVLRLYPRNWRQRYEEEMLAMLELCPSSFLDRVDLVFGALDAHLHPHLGTTGLSLYERMKYMLSLLRRSLLTIFCASIGFLLAGLGFQKMNEYDDFLRAAQTYSLVGLSYHLVGIGTVVLFLAVLGGGLPIASAIVESSLVRKRYGPVLATWDVCSKKRPFRLSNFFHTFVDGLRLEEAPRIVLFPPPDPTATWLIEAHVWKLINMLLEGKERRGVAFTCSATV